MLGVEVGVAVDVLEGIVAMIEGLASVAVTTRGDGIPQVTARHAINRNKTIPKKKIAPTL